MKFTSPVDAIAEKKLRIEYKNYERQMMLKEGVMLVGWSSRYGKTFAKYQAWDRHIFCKSAG
jgi:hypothetical protein